MREEEVKELLERTGAWRRGHFILSSGLHSDIYIQCALVLQYPEHATRLGAALAEMLSDLSAEVVIAPALGGILVAHEVARALGVRSLFTERVGGKMELRRGFVLRTGERALVVEDVVTTGGSVEEVAKVVREWGADVVGFGALVDRSQRPLPFTLPFRSLLRAPVRAWEPSVCPLCREGIPTTKPGSRGL
ncbi:orotate phosphoribosyltransferase [Desulfothermobacter acidiphilus]|uniref:orotate phosphoribosyltransferase n=1 Tax=Desulfothermobacter acidiphilus TaxID=1938353 RepID=UPI003F892E2C